LKNTEQGTIYFLLDELYSKEKFSVLNFLRAIKNLEVLKYFKICFVRRIKPVGGVKVIYQHCLALRNAGYKSEIIQMGDYVDVFFGFELKTIRIEELGYQLNAHDVVIATEFRPYNGLLFAKAKKVLFAQNWAGFTLFLAAKDRANGFSGLGYQHVVTCSDVIFDKLAENDKSIATIITNGIDLNIFKPAQEIRKRNRVLAFNRKNPEDVGNIKKLLEDSDHEFELVIVDSLTERELVLEYQKADIFIATGYPEGFGLPALEAMACGCVVVGFSGGGGLEYMVNGVNSLIAEDGDTITAANHTMNCLSNQTLKEGLRAKGLQTALNFSLDKMNERIIATYSEICS
jgi:glycosyltransferase involved in cell wall biosynthesis